VVAEGWAQIGATSEDGVVQRAVAVLAKAAESQKVWNPTVVVRLAEWDFDILAPQGLRVRQRLAALITGRLAAQGRQVGRIRVVIEPAANRREPFVILDGRDRNAVPTRRAGFAGSDPNWSPQQNPAVRGAPPLGMVDEPLFALRIVVDGRRIPVLATELVLGRAVPMPGRLSDPEVGRRHCSVRAAGPVVLCVDLGSVNGTWVDGARIRWPTQVRPGHVLRVGRIEFVAERW
jgi:hypothetical protein